MVKKFEQRGAPGATQPQAGQPAEQPVKATIKNIPLLREEKVRHRATKETMKAAALARKAEIKPELTQELLAEQLYFERLFIVERQNSFMDRIRPVLTVDRVLGFMEEAIQKGLIAEADVSQELAVMRNRENYFPKAQLKRWKMESPFIGGKVFQGLLTKKIKIPAQNNKIVEAPLIDWLTANCLGTSIKESLEKKKNDEEIKGQNLTGLFKARRKAEMYVLKSGLERYKLSTMEIAQLDSGESGELIAAYKESFGGEFRTFRAKRRAVIKGIKEAQLGGSPLTSMSDSQIAGRENLPLSNASAVRADVNNVLAFIDGEEPVAEVSPIEMADAWKKSVNEETVAAYVKYQSELHDLWKQLHQGVIVETPYVKEVIEQAMEALKKNPPGLVYFHGDHGTGKTALTKHIAQKLLSELGRPDDLPMIISANKFLEPDKFTDDFRLQKLGTAEFLNQMHKEIFGTEGTYDDKKNSSADLVNALVGTKIQFREDIFKKRLTEDYRALELSGKKPSVSLEEYCADKANQDALPLEYKISVDKSLDNMYSNPVQGKYMLGAMYFCMKNGLPLIIDEANAMTPEVAIAFNDLYTKKIQEEIHTRTGETFTVRQGFCIMWTGNTGKRFSQARHTMDAAAYSRIIPIKYNYLPQSTAASSSATLSERLANVERLSAMDLTPAQIAESRELAQKDQIFQVLLVKMLNSRQGAELLARRDAGSNHFDRLSVVKDLMNMSRAARITMCLFTEEKVGIDLGLSKILAGGANSEAAYHEALNVANLTMRELLDKILNRYVDSGMALDIEYHLWQFIRNYDEHPEAQAVMYRILQEQEFFSPAQGWPAVFTSQKDFVKAMTEFKPLTTVPKYIRMEENGAYYSLAKPEDYQLTYIPSLEVMQMIYGYLPARKEAAYEGLRGTEAWKASEKKKLEGDKELIKLNAMRSKVARFEKRWVEFYENEDWTRYEKMTSAQSTQLTEDLFVKFSPSKIYDEDWLDLEKNPNLEQKEYMEQCKKMIEHVAKRLVEFGITTYADAAAGAAEGAESQIDLVLSKLGE
jgi:hypothetical protein